MLHTVRTVSGLSQPGQRTNFLIKMSSICCSFPASCAPLTIKRSFLMSNCVCAPNSQPKNLVGSKRTEIHLNYNSFYLSHPILTSWWTSERFSYLCHVHNDSFNAISFAFYLGQKARHFITIKCIRNVSIYVESTHGYGFLFLCT